MLPCLFGVLSAANSKQQPRREHVDMRAVVQGSDADILWFSFTEEEAALAVVVFSQETFSHTI